MSRTGQIQLPEEEREGGREGERETDSTSSQ